MYPNKKIKNFKGQNGKIKNFKGQTVVVSLWMKWKAKFYHRATMFLIFKRKKKQRIYS